MSPEYAQALAFDQLRKIMEAGRAFVGFQEAPITFPPTFKYDVVRPMRRRRSSSKPLASPFMPSTPVLGHQKLLTHVTEREGETSSSRITESNVVCESEPEPVQEQEREKERDPDAASVVSSTFTSARSKYTSQSHVDEGQDAGDDEDLFFSATTKTKTGKVIQRLSLTAVKAKAKWVSMVSPARADLMNHMPSKRRNK